MAGTTKRMRHIEELCNLQDTIERAQQRIETLRIFIGATPCGLCGREAKIETWCYGCRNFICDRCEADVLDPPTGTHQSEAHRAEETDAAAAETGADS